MAPNSSYGHIIKYLRCIHNDAGIAWVFTLVFVVVRVVPVSLDLKLSESASTTPEAVPRLAARGIAKYRRRGANLCREIDRQTDRWMDG